MESSLRHNTTYTSKPAEGWEETESSWSDKTLSHISVTWNSLFPLSYTQTEKFFIMSLYTVKNYSAWLKCHPHCNNICHVIFVQFWVIKVFFHLNKWIKGSNSNCVYFISYLMCVPKHSKDFHLAKWFLSIMS